MIEQAIQTQPSRPLSLLAKTRLGSARIGATGPRRSGQGRAEPIPFRGRHKEAPALSIEEAIRQYLESQPPQLYRGGA